MSRPPRGDRFTVRGRPKRRAAAKANIFKYQLAADPSRAEENDLKRALQESLEEQRASVSDDKSNRVIKAPNSKRAKLDQQHAASPEVTIIGTIPAASPAKRTRFSPGATNGHQQNNNNNNRNKNKNKNKCDVSPNSSITLDKSSPPSVAQLHNRAIRTYSRGSHQSSDIDSQHANSNKNTDNKSHNCLESTSFTSKSTTIPKSQISSDSRDTNGDQPKTKSLSNQSSVSRSTQTPACKAKVNSNSDKSSPSSSSTATDAPSKTNSVTRNSSPTKDNGTTTASINGLNPPVQDQYLKSKRESKNYAYVKMTALKVSTEKFPRSHSRNSNPKKASPKSILNNSSANKDSLKATQQKARDNSSNGTYTNTNSNLSNPSKYGSEAKNSRKEEMKSSLKHDTASNNKKCTTFVPPMSLTKQETVVKDTGIQLKGLNCAPNSGSPTKVNLDESGIEYDCSPAGTNLDLSNDRDQSQTSVNVIQKRNPQGSWSLLGVPEEKVIYIRDDEPPRRLICYPAIKHVEGDVIQVRDSVLLRSGARKTDLPYIAKVCAFWEDAETGGVRMSLFWYYRPEHTEDGRKPHHLVDEIFASRHRDVDTVECIEDKCYVLTFNEYCRYRKRCKMEQVNTAWSLTDVTIPMSNESYPRRNRIPESDVNPELVFCCRQVYDSRLKRLLKNPLINSKYGHI